MMVSLPSRAADDDVLAAGEAEIVRIRAGSAQVIADHLAEAHGFEDRVVTKRVNTFRYPRGL